MKITNVEAIYLRIPDLDETICDGTQDTLIIKIHTDEGLTGIGEVDSVPLVAKAIVEAPPSHSIAAGLNSLLKGENPYDIERLWDKMNTGAIYLGRSGAVMHAISGVDIALWDLAGKAAGRPVYSMLGGARTRRLTAYASTLMPDTPIEAAKLAETFALQGYRYIKFGWGPIGRDAKLDEQLISEIRNAVGDQVHIMIDGGLAWDLRGALKISQIYEQYNVYWLEEPLHPDNLDGYRELSRRTNIRIAGGEQESGRLAFGRLMDEANIDVIQPDLSRCGGITEGKRIATMAVDRHKKVVPHAFKSGILTSATAHFIAAIPNGDLMEYTVSQSPLARQLVKNPLEWQEGYVIVPEGGSGLGIELDEAIVRKYKVG